ncbi:sulfatase-like hydrolase/transferase [Flammeovirga yaeyamensis]|uniref:Sulfatase-like hydrolase/transferase n=1 Tax=Flammeovirga yaeyamensis TaxID=367791 RepID=A0AAX1N3G8_9BACT|nr:sialate O-acetylesterase [Flammeovirga yaeyamensis]MBB3700762.1 arylsulfatase A-like enzyme [Flammeovirga yaeyamensis]NMF37882.1 sulfatase-like hydrolase/transferase [Flammeovirga yaeyamensis]QWG01757.1 sulfatase-like hydrolase/transferase [Flammeovirga yaeyamensis]
MNKSLFFILLLYISSSINVFSQRILEESFDYPSNRLLVENPSEDEEVIDPVTGWAITQEGIEVSPIKITEVGLSYNGYPSSGNAIELVNGANNAQNAYRSLEGTYSEGELYFSMLVSVSGDDVDGDMFFSPRENNPSDKARVLRGRVLAKVQDGKVIFGLDKGQESVWASVECEKNVAHLLVMKYSFIEGDDNDEVELFINPDPTLEEPQGADVMTSNGDDRALSSIILRQRRDGVESLILDELRFGTSWEDIANLPSEENDLTITAVKVNGHLISAYENTMETLEVDVPYNQTEAFVEVELKNELAQITIDQSENIQGSLEERTATITITAPDQSSRKVTLVFNKAPEMDIYVALGQSNMAGRAEITEEVSGEIDNVFLLNKINNWTAASNPMNQFSNILKEAQYQGVSPSYAFAKTVSAYTDKKIGLIVNARGGTSLAQFSTGEYSAPLKSRIAEVAKFGEVKSILWHQGEADSSKPDTYLSSLNTFVDQLRSILENQDAYFIAGQLGGWNRIGEETPKYGDFNEMLTGISDQIENSDYVENTNLEHIDGDDAHFDTKSQLLLGQKYAQKVLSKIYNIEIGILNIDYNGEGKIVIDEFELNSSVANSITSLKGEEKELLIQAPEGKVITQLLVNGSEVNEAEGESEYTLSHQFDVDYENLKIEATFNYEEVGDVPPPNIIFIISDQHAGNFMPYKGHSIQTPGFDKLADNGVVFNRGYCSFPVCISSRRSIFTGRMPSQGSPETDYLSLGKAVKDLGYNTGYFGKWHIGNTKYETSLEWNGFDEYEKLKHNDTDVTNRSIQYIQDHKDEDKPFFLVTSLLNPHNCCELARIISNFDYKIDFTDGEVPHDHDPALCPPLPDNFEIPFIEPEGYYARRYPVPGSEHWDSNHTSWWTIDQWRQYLYGYELLVEKIDNHVGHIYETLEAEGLLENTLIVYTTDHGDGVAAHRWSSKKCFYEEVMNIPYIMSWKGQTTPNVIDDESIVSLVDIYPTLVSIAGGELPSHLAGQDLSGNILRNNGGKEAVKRDYLVSELYQHVYNPLPARTITGRMVVTKELKYVLFDGGFHREILHDLEKDPGEMESFDRDPAYAEKLAMMRGYLKEWVEEINDDFDVDGILQGYQTDATLGMVTLDGQRIPGFNIEERDFTFFINTDDITAELDIKGVANHPDCNVKVTQENKGEGDNAYKDVVIEVTSIDETITSIYHFTLYKFESNVIFQTGFPVQDGQTAPIGWSSKSTMISSNIPDPMSSHGDFLGNGALKFTRGEEGNQGHLTSPEYEDVKGLSFWAFIEAPFGATELLVEAVSSNGDRIKLDVIDRSLLADDEWRYFQYKIDTDKSVQIVFTPTIDRQPDIHDDCRLWIDDLTIYSEFEYHTPIEVLFEDNFEDGAGNDFQWWIQKGYGVLGIFEGSIDGYSALFGRDISSIESPVSFKKMGELSFKLKPMDEEDAIEGAMFSVSISEDQMTWEKYWEISHEELINANKVLEENITINGGDKEYYMKFESNIPEGTTTEGVFILDDVMLIKENSDLSDVRISSISTDTRTVSDEELKFTLSSDDLFSYIANDSIGVFEDIFVNITPRAMGATVTIHNQPSPLPGEAGEMNFTVTAANGYTTQDYTVTVYRSKYHQYKIGFLKGGGSDKIPTGWTSGGANYVGDKGNHGLYPGDNIFRMYYSESKDEFGYLITPTIERIGKLSFAGRFGKTDMTEKLVVSKSTNGGETWEELKTYTPNDGIFPAYEDEDKSDPLTMDEIDVYESNVMIKFQYGNDTHPTLNNPRLGIDDIGIKVDVIEVPITFTDNVRVLYKGKELSSGDLIQPEMGTDGMVELEILTNDNQFFEELLINGVEMIEAVATEKYNYSFNAVTAKSIEIEATLISNEEGPTGIIGDNNQVTIYPNPVKNMLKINGLEEPFEADIYTVNGRKVFTIKNQTHFYIGGTLKTGIYIMKIKTENGLIVKRIMID